MTTNGTNPLARLMHYLRSMRYPHVTQLALPIENFRANSYGFGVYCSYDGIPWGRHLGEDMDIEAGTKVRCIGRGRVVYAALHAGKPNPNPTAKPSWLRNWGHIVIVGHRDPLTDGTFFSIYGHMEELRVKKGMRVEQGQVLGVVGASHTPKNGYWVAHLHLGIFTGEWPGHVLPGYHNPPKTVVTMDDFHPATDFIKKYNIAHTPKKQLLQRARGQQAKKAATDRGRH